VIQKTLFNLFAAVAASAMLIVPQFAHAENLTRPVVVKKAAQLKGIPYVWGGESLTGFDCSGLVQYVFGKAHIQLPRTADAQMAYGSPVPYSSAKPGDLMFFNTGNKPGEVTHVGIYMGNGHMLHAPRPGKKVQFASVSPRSWFRPRLLGIRRVGKHTFALARKPVGWELSQMPQKLNIKLPFRDAVQTASIM
jgi:hypothetical protein